MDRADSDGGAVEAGGGSGVFASLAVRNYRYFETGAFVSNVGTWVARIAQDWLILTITGSSFSVGLTTALQFIPVILGGLYGGVIADRYARRVILMWTQVAMALLGLALALLTLSGHIHAWHVYVAALVAGIVSVFDTPARRAFVSELVGQDRIQNAISFDAANFQSARLIGPGIAGVLIATTGTGWAFVLNSVSFVVMFGTLALIRSSELYSPIHIAGNAGRIRAGLSYVYRRPTISWTVVLVAVVGTFAYNFQAWLTGFVETVFDGTAASYSKWNVVIAVGSVVGAVLGARRKWASWQLVVVSALIFGLLEVVAALSPTPWLFIGVLCAVGFFGVTFNISATASVQLATSPHFRGRVMSLYTLAFLGGVPIGGPLMGWIADALGARTSFAAGGGVTAVAALCVGVVLLRLRRREGRDLADPHDSEPEV